MELISEKSRKVAWDLIVVAENHYHLNAKGGLIGMNLLRTAKGYKMSKHQAFQDLSSLWHSSGSWGSRESVLKLAAFMIRAYELVPQNLLHETLEKALADEGLRIRDGQLRRIVTKAQEAARS